MFIAIWAKMVAVVVARSGCVQDTFLKVEPRGLLRNKMWSVSEREKSKSSLVSLTWQLKGQLIYCSGEDGVEQVWGEDHKCGFDHAILKMPIRKSRDVEEAATHLQFKEEVLEMYI